MARLKDSHDKKPITGEKPAHTAYIHRNQKQSFRVMDPNSRLDVKQTQHSSPPEVSKHGTHHTDSQAVAVQPSFSIRAHVVEDPSAVHAISKPNPVLETIHTQVKNFRLPVHHAESMPSSSSRESVHARPLFPPAFIKSRPLRVPGYQQRSDDAFKSDNQLATKMAQPPFIQQAPPQFPQQLYHHFLNDVRLLVPQSRTPFPDQSSTENRSNYLHNAFPKRNPVSVGNTPSPRMNAPRNSPQVVKKSAHFVPPLYSFA